MGQVCNTIMQAIHSIFAAKGAKYDFTPWDFIPEYGVKRKKKIQEPKKQTVEELKAAILSIVGQTGRRKRKYPHG